MSTSIKFRNVEFTDKDLLSGNIVAEKSMISESISADKLTFTVLDSQRTACSYLASNTSMLCSTTSRLIAYQVGPGKWIDYSSAKFGEPVYFSHSGGLKSTFYVQNVIRIGENVYQFNCTSAMGILLSSTHYGGVYTGESLRNVIADVLGGVISYTIDSDIALSRVYGRLKIQSRREQLKDLMFQCGGSIMKNSDGSVRICYYRPDSYWTISDDDNINGGSVTYKDKATRVSVTEHSYTASNEVETKVLFDNSSDSSPADHAVITFSEAVQTGTLTGTGITIHNSYPNYMIVSGNGKVTGKEYLHVERVVTKTIDNPQATEEKEVSISDETLVNPLNVNNVLERVAKLYGHSNEISCSLVVNNNIKAGEYVSLRNPYNENSTGYISSMSINVSGKLKSSTKIVTDWTPGPFDNNFNYYALLTSNQTWTVPQDVTKIKVIIVGGSRGGQGGSIGQAGVAGAGRKGSQYGGAFQDPGTPGAGGVGGAAAIGAMVYTVDIDTSAGTQYAVTIGAGGAGGAASTTYGQAGALGSLGGASTFGSYSSNSGGENTAGLVNFLTGDTYIKRGTNGIAGGNGGATGANGSSVTYKGVTYSGGSKGANGGSYVPLGGGGGGAAAGNAGNNGTAGVVPQYYWYTYAGSGGAGANAATPAAAAMSVGGDGGSGGGGGGANGTLNYTGGTGQDCGFGSAGGAGYGSSGGQGGQGFVLIYY